VRNRLVLIAPLLALVLAACGGGGSKSSNTTSAPTTTSSSTPTTAGSDAAATARAQKLVLVQSDFPAGWTGSPPTPDTPEDKAANQEFAACAGASGESDKVADVKGDTFSMGSPATQVGSGAQIVKDEARYRQLTADGWVSRQRYDQAKAAADSAEAQLAAAEAQADVARNEAGYSRLLADADGTVVETLAEPGQVVAAGQTVVKLAHAGPREATVNLPETVRPAIGSPALARVYGSASVPSPAHLRQLSDAADPSTRTYEARYVLDGDASRAPLGATVTISVATDGTTEAAEVPLGALYDDGKSSGVWVVDPHSSSVLLRAVQVRRLAKEIAVVSGVEPGERVVALGAHLLHQGERVRLVDDRRAAQ